MLRSIKGIKTTLVEISEIDASNIVKLRNDPKYNAFLAQKPFTIQEQLSWTDKEKKKNDTVNFKVLNNDGEFKGTVSIYDIINNRGEFGRYIVTNPINAIEAEYLILKYSFEELKLNVVFCQTNLQNKSVWQQHLKFGFKTIETKEVLVGSAPQISVKAVVQEISKAEFENFDYGKMFELVKKF
jgi:RimJ/RimL family protein N-acetyltransferase